MKKTYKAPQGQKPGADVKSFPGVKMSGAAVIPSAKSMLMKGATNNRPAKGCM